MKFRGQEIVCVNDAIQLKKQILNIWKKVVIFIKKNVSLEKIFKIQKKICSCSTSENKCSKSPIKSFDKFTFFILVVDNH